MIYLCSKFSFPITSRWWLVLILICCTATSIHAQETTDVKSVGEDTLTGAQQSSIGKFTVRPIRTDSPRKTLKTFLRLRNELEQALRIYKLKKSRKLASHMDVIYDQLLALLDLSLVSSASRREIGIDTIACLLDILGRVELPDIDSVPGEEAFEDEAKPARWRIPGTPIRIARVDQGSREGEFLFSDRTVRAAPRFYRGIENIPLKSTLPITSWNLTLPQITGPMIPAVVLRHVPYSMRDFWMGTPKWKVIAVVLGSVLAALMLVVFHRAINRRKTASKVSFLLRRTLTPIVILLMTWNIRNFIAYQIDVSGAFSFVVDTTATILIHAGTVWLLYLVVLAIFERIIQAWKVPEESFDAHLLRLGARTLGYIVSILIIGRAAQVLGLPLYSVVGGLGIGGLAVALAIRPTLENLIGGIVLYMDQPVRVGDFCSFGDKTGTVETIGVRSTKIRALDRTMITVPNSILADMQLINWAKCDRMLINTTIGLRYETKNDQLRHVLVKFREMLHAHPKIHSETVRVRFAGFGQSSLDIGVRIYVLTPDFNEFHAIREDVFLRMSDIVKESGSSFAFPSQTLYMGSDDGLDDERGQTAAKEVESWRKAGKLPFPRLSADRIGQLEDTLDYPPRGSVEVSSLEAQVWETSERVSAKPDEEEESERKSASKKREDDS